MDFAKLLTKFDSIAHTETVNEAWPGTAEWKKKQPGFNPYDPEGKEKKKLELKPYGYRGPSGADTDDEPKSSKSPKKDKKSKKVKESDEVNEDDVEEGNEFSGELAKAKAAGKDEFEVGGKTYKVKESQYDEEDLDEAEGKDEKKDGEETSAEKDDTEEPDDKEEKPEETGKKPEDDLVMYRYLLGGNANYSLIKSFLDHVERGDAIPGPMVKEYAPVIKMIDNIVKSGPSAINYIRMAQNFAAGPKTDTVSEYKEIAECYDQAMSSMSDQQSGLNINSSLDTKTGSQSLTVTAQGDAADQLAQLLKLSGILTQGVGQAEMSSMDVDMGEDYANEPNPVVQGVATQINQGNDLHRAKKTYPKVNGGDNPMQKIAVAEEAQVSEIEQRLTKLMEELSTIKVPNKKNR